MSENYDVIVIFQDYGQFGAIRKPDYIFINSNQFISQKLKTELKYLKQNSHAITFWVKVLFLQKKRNFLAQKADTIKIKRVLILNDIFSETTYLKLMA